MLHSDGSSTRFFQNFFFICTKFDNRLIFVANYHTSFQRFGLVLLCCNRVSGRCVMVIYNHVHYIVQCPKITISPTIWCKTPTISLAFNKHHKDYPIVAVHRTGIYRCRLECSSPLKNSPRLPTSGIFSTFLWQYLRAFSGKFIKFIVMQISSPFQCRRI